MQVDRPAPVPRPSGCAGWDASPTPRRWDLQRAVAARSDDDYLLLLEHGHVYTLGAHADPAHVLVDPATVGAELVHGRPRWRRHLPRPGPAGRLPGPSTVARPAPRARSTSTRWSRW